MKRIGMILLSLLIAWLPLESHSAKASPGDTVFVSVSTMLSNAIALDNMGNIWGLGDNSVGQYGNGTTSGSANGAPEKVTVLEGGNPVSFQDVQTGGGYTIALDDNGRLWSTGSNDDGQLGNGTTTNSLTWGKLSVMDGGTEAVFTQIAIGRFSAFAIDSHRHLWAWGFRTTSTPNVPTALDVMDGGSLAEFASIQAYDEFVLGIDTTNHLWNLFNVSIVSMPKYALMDGASEALFQSVAVGTEVDGSFVGYLEAALDTNGQIWTWGTNKYGQFGNGSTSTDSIDTPEKRVIMDGGSVVQFTQASAGNSYMLALDDKGDMWAWGKDDQGQLGDGATSNPNPHKVSVMNPNTGGSLSFASVVAGNERSYGIDDDGAIWTWGRGQTTPALLKHNPSVSLSVSDAATTYLQETTLTASVSGDVGMPSGTVTFKDGATTLGNVTLMSGSASLDVSNLGVGNHSIQVDYSGDAGYNSMTSGNSTVTVSLPTAPSLVITPSTMSSTFDPVTMTVSPTIHGEGNGLQALKWLPGSKTVGNFAGSGTDITVAKTFDATSNGTYTVYVEDKAGNKKVQTATVNNIQAAGDATALEAEIAVAQQKLTDHAEGSSVGDAPAVARTTLGNAITAAQAVDAAKASKTQAELDSARTTLEAAVTAFDGAVIGAGDATALEAVIATAEQRLVDHPQGTGVGDAPSGARATLQSAIADAQAVDAAKASKTQAELDSARTTLEAAVTAFDGAVIGAGDATALEAVIATAEQRLVDHPQGTGVGDAPSGARATLQSAIADAQAVDAAKASKTQAELDSARTTLEAAVTAFDGAVIGAGDATALEAAIAVAQQRLVDHTEGTSIGDAPAAARTTLGNAISAAQAVDAAKASKTQAELDSAQTALEAAVTAFDGAVIGAGDAAALEAVIATAEQRLVDHAEGSSVGDAPAAARTALGNAIDAAQAVDDAKASKTQAELDSARTTLEAAVTAFNGAVIGAGDAAALEAEIAVAQQKLTDHAEGSSVGDAPAAARTTLGNAISAAQAVDAAKASKTQAELNSAQTTLEAAVTAFDGAVIGAGDATALEAAIAVAQQRLVDHTEGTSIGEAPAAARTTLGNAISAAQAVDAAKASKTQAELNSAQTTLEAAVTAFDGAVIGAGDAAALEAVITTAEQRLVDHPQGTGVGDAPSGARATLQSAIADAQAVDADAVNQSQTELDAATAVLNAAIADFDAALVGVVISAPADGLYGVGQDLSITVTYGYDVVVTGMPRVLLAIGTGSVTQSVYAIYDGQTDTALTHLHFTYAVPANIADEDGIEMGSELNLPDGATIMRQGGGAADLSYAAPNTTDVRIVAIEPAITLSSVDRGATAEISVTASAYGESSTGNQLTALRWALGSQAASDFASGTFGSDILTTSIFTVTQNGVYTVFAEDSAGNQATEEITVSSISPAVTNPDPAMDSADNDEEPLFPITLSWNENNSNAFSFTEKELRETILAVDGDQLMNGEVSEWELSLPRKTVKKLLAVNKNGVIQIQSRLGVVEIPVALFGNLNLGDAASIAITLGQDKRNASSQWAEAADTIGATVHGLPIQLHLLAVNSDGSTEIASWSEYISVTSPLEQGMNQDATLISRYDHEQDAYTPIPALLDAEWIQWKARAGGVYVLLSHEKQFADVQGTWAENLVNRMGSKLIVNGIDEEHFAPMAQVTRAELTTMLVRALGIIEPTGGPEVFSDVDSQAWYAGFVAAAYGEGLVHGYDDGSFRPDASVSRQEATVMFMNAMRHREIVQESSEVRFELSDMSDASMISSWAADEMAEAMQAGIIQGDAEHQLHPQQPITRAEAAAMLERMLIAIGFLN
ncbi:S-layer homology domain-containing protein [Paenibacillus sp. HB172176]|uniref:S-layer homology domain-containing protein n=1 Tax=Paenibacillus sp. HB172176 TaxID=2493690 RepID=UPI00143AFA87|nr:S-layer homology domain-containing protein [Paenibacillus sp. HB172176]